MFLSVLSLGFLLLAIPNIGDAAEPTNLLVVVEKGSPVAGAAIEAAHEYLDKNQGAKVGEQSVVEVEAMGEAMATVNTVCSALDAMIGSDSAPDIVLDLTTAGEHSVALKSLLMMLGLPTVSAAHGMKGDIMEWRDLTEEQKKYLIQVRPPGDVLPDIIRSLASATNITNAGILYDTSFVMSHKYKSLLLNMPVRHIISKVKSGRELEKQLRRFQEVDIHNYFVLGSSETIHEVFSTGNSLKMFGNEKYAWFAGTKESNKDFDPSCCDDMQVAFFTPTVPQGAQIKSIKSQYNLKVTPEIDAAFYFDLAIRAVTAVDKMKNMASWPELSLSKCSEFNSENPVIRQLDLLGALKSTSMSNTWGPMKLVSNGESFMEFDMRLESYNIIGKKVSERAEIGVWSASSPPAPIAFSAGGAQKITSFRAKTVYKVVTVVQPPFMMWNATTGKYEGYCVDLIEELKALMGFDYELYEAPDKKFGSMSEAGEWDGMVAELVNKKADIALGSLSVMSEREHVIDFTVPYYDLVGITIMMKKPKVPTSLFKFLSVLEESVWGCILAAYFVTSVLLWVFDRWSPYSYQNNMEKYEDDEEKRYFNFKESLWFCMTSLTPQGGGEAPKNLSGRLVAATWWLFGFIIIASYTANLAAFLTVSRLESAVEDLEGLSSQYKIQYAPQNGSATATYFERMAYIEHRFYEIWKAMSLNDSLSEVERSKLAVWDYPVSDKYTKIWQSMKEAELPSTFEVALERVRASPSSSEGFAFLGDATDIRYQELTNCDLQMVGDEFSRKPYALAVQQGSPLKDQFNDAILKLLNQRKLETLKERWWNQNPQKKACEEADDNSGGISIHNIGGVFIVIFIGIGLAIVTLAAEYWYYKYKAPSTRVSSVEISSRKKENNGTSEFRTDLPEMAPVANPW